MHLAPLEGGGADDVVRVVYALPMVALPGLLAGWIYDGRRREQTHGYERRSTQLRK